jgi:Zn-dependent M28 family amino/carboxypeptidase
VRFIANAGEEKGLLGAGYCATHSTVPIQQIVSVVDLDMPLLLYDFTDIVAFGADHSTVARTVAQAAQSMGVSLSADPMPQESIFTRSDHYQFVKRGVPATAVHRLSNEVSSIGTSGCRPSPTDDSTQAINGTPERATPVNYQSAGACRRRQPAFVV